jgi:anion-transporting  ArsA/GET3 family ATPase
VVVAGKGGVGRTTVAAALAASLAAAGRRTLLIQANAKEKLAQFLGGPVVGEDVIPVRENLWAVNANPAAALHEYGLMILRYEAIYKMVFENRLTKALVRAIPGVDDYSILGKVWWHATQEQQSGRPRWDTVVFDAPATGHAVTMLRIPEAILSAVPEGPLTRDALKVKQLLQDPRQTALLLVTLAEEMPANETLELRDRLKNESGITAQGLVVNQVFPDRFPKGTGPARLVERLQAGLATKPDPLLSAMLARAHTVKSRREMHARYLTKLAELGLPMAVLPFVFVPMLGKAEVGALAGMLAKEMKA